MANANRPFGAKAARKFDGSPYDAAAMSFHVPASYAPAIFLGDPVIMTGNGNAVSFLGAQPGTLAEVALTAVPPAGGGAPAPLSYAQYILGFVVAVEPITRESTIYRAANVEAMVKVIADPDVIWEVQDNGAVALGVNVCGLNANLIAGAGSTTTGQSGWMLDAGTTNAPGTSLNLQMTILNASNRVTNDATSQFAIWETLINWHPFTAPAIGI